MPRATAWYVEGRKLVFPYGVRLVSGPFDTMGEATTERDRIAPLYPDAGLQATSYTGKSLPERRPRTVAPQMRIGEGQVADAAHIARLTRAYDLSRVAGRRSAALDLADHARALGAEVTVEDWDGEPDVDIATPSLRANIWLMRSADGSVPIISWHSAAFPLRAVPDAWPAGFNYWRSKATSTPCTWSALFVALEAGICAAIDGNAFDFSEVTK